jgi:hypothetical protein
VKSCHRIVPALQLLGIDVAPRLPVGRLGSGDTILNRSGYSVQGPRFTTGRTRATLDKAGVFGLSRAV